MMAQVEGMPLAALENGIDWSWESFDEYLGGLEGRIAVNAGFLVGHCALRRYVLGEESLERESTEGELKALVALLHQSLEAGGLGLSTTRSTTHPDHNGQPVPSRQASEEEVLALCRTVGEHAGTTLETIFSGCVTMFSDSEIELLAQMSAQANRPLNWNVLGIRGSAGGELSDRERIAHQMRPTARAREIGGRVVALTMPVHSDMNLSMATYCAMWLIPGWREIMQLPLREKTAALRDPQTRARMVAAAQGTGFEFMAEFGRYQIGDTLAPENKRYEGRFVADIAKERGMDAWDALIDIEAADEYKTVLWPKPIADEIEDWELRRQVWQSDDVIIGGSDAGAHLDRMLGSPYPTRFLADTIRGRQLITVERAVQLMTDRPARLYGLTDRGRIAPGARADLVVFDPSSIDSGPARRVYDLPGDSLRLTASSVGVEAVLVNGVETIRQGQPTGAFPGTVLRSGRHTETVSAR
jgi:N-acyl-D-aspartate/D-glutamate deacylase